MQISLFKKIKKYNDYFNNSSDLIKSCQIINREIIIDIITPQIATQIDNLIRFWNLEDEDEKILLMDREPIKIYINSLGGDLTSALTILDSIKMSKTPVYTFNIGTVNKEALLPYLGGHKRYAYLSSSFSWLPLTQEEPPVNESSFCNYTNHIEKIQDDIQNFIIEKTSITETQFEKYGKNEWWFNAEDAIKYHICNEISRNHYYHERFNK